MSMIASNSKKIIKRVKNYILLTIAAFIYAISISLFLDPNNIAPGGITGVSILINRFTHIPTGTLNLMLNIPIILLGLWKFGVGFIASTFYTLAAITVFTNYLSSYGAVTDDLLIASVMGGGLLAIAIGMVFKAGATTGGADIIIKVLRLRWKHIKTGVLFLCFDFMVVLASWAVFHNLTVAFYAGIAVAVDSIVIDYVLYGPDEAKLIYIISDNPHPIKERILAEMDITATILQGKGAYSMKDKNVLMVVMRKQAAPVVEEIVKEEDPNAFMIVSSASEIFGEGYKDIRHDRI